MKVNHRIHLCLAKMSDNGMEQKYIQEAFDTNWVAPLGPNVDAFEEALKCHFERSEAESRNPLGLQLLFEWIRSFGFSFSQCESIFASLNGEPGKEFYSPDYQLVIEKETVEIFPINLNLNNPKLSFEKIGKTPNFSLLTTNLNVARLDYDTLHLPLKTRTWRQGDRFRPLGMRGTKLVSDFFNDNNFTTFQKKTTPILVDSDDQIVWIIGYRIDDRFKITEKTKTIYEINFAM